MSRLGYFTMSLCIAVWGASARAAEIDWSRVEAALGRSANMQPDGVHKFGFPRTDLHVTLDGVPLQPAFALGSWLAFKDDGDGAIVMGDLVLLEDEVAPVMKRLLDGGIEITALHNHLLRARPMPMYMHVLGKGDAVQLAKTLHEALTASKTPLEAPRGTRAATVEPTLDTEMLDEVLGRKGKANGSVYQFGFRRAESIHVGDFAVPASMGTSVGINFESTGAGKAAVTGDFVLLADEVEPVMQALTRGRIEATALHNHMLAESPRLYFMHFWANGDARTLARGLRTALDRMNVAGR